MTCTSCHTSMEAVGSADRKPWVDEPRCDNCHHLTGKTYEQPDTLYRNSVGHYGVPCAACHGSPHAITPTSQPNDNVQAIGLQGTAGPIKDCTVCHTGQVRGTFKHTVDGAP
jgi:hypothetical protein